MSGARLEAEEHGVKAYVFGRCLLAQIISMEEGGTSMDEDIRKALKEGTEFCVEALERRAGGSEGESMGDMIDESPLGGFDWDASVSFTLFDAVASVELGADADENGT